MLGVQFEIAQVNRAPGLLLGAALSAGPFTDALPVCGVLVAFVVGHLAFTAQCGDTLQLPAGCPAQRLARA